MDSSFYYREMMDTANEKRRFQDIREQYLRYVEKLKKLQKQISPIIDNVTRAENCFLDGGYISDGKSLSEGQLTKKASDLNDTINSITVIIRKTTDKIEELDGSIERLTNLYSDLQESYQEALRREREES